MFEKRMGPTPCGGAYSIAFYLDEKEHPVGKKDAVIVRICEYDENGNVLKHTTGFRTEKKRTGRLK